MRTQTISSPHREAKTIAKSSILLEFLFLLLLFVVSHLLTDNMSENEVGKLMLAKQFITPQWLPNDWYLTQPQTYQALFQVIFGKSISILGFLLTSIIGRLSYYSITSLALVLIAREIKLNFLPLFLSIAIFLSLGQSIPIAGEWMIGGLETKGFAYGLILLSIWLTMKKRYLWIVATLGLATSFHILVGGYATLTIPVWIAWKKFKSNNLFTEVSQNFRLILSVAIVYILTSLFAFIPLILNLNHFSELSGEALHATYIYTFLRNSHHLDPFAWQKIRFFILAVYLFLLFRCQFYFKDSLRKIGRNNASKQAVIEQRIILSELTFVSLIPLFIGFLAVPFDTQGIFLQYYPFRFGSLLLSLNVPLLLACIFQISRAKFKSLVKSKKMLRFFCLLFIGAACLFPVKNFAKELVELKQFPVTVEGLNQESLAAFAWLKINTPQDALIISSPTQFVGFNWLTDRATIAKFKLVPSTEIEIIEWYKRLNDLSGHPEFWEWEERGFAVADRLDADYQKLTTGQVESLMQKYDSSYFFTNSDHYLDLAIAYENAEYRIYRTPTEFQNLLQ